MTAGMLQLSSCSCRVMSGIALTNTDVPNCRVNLEKQCSDFFLHPTFSKMDCFSVSGQPVPISNVASREQLWVKITQVGKGQQVLCSTGHPAPARAANNRRCIHAQAYSVI